MARTKRSEAQEKRLTKLRTEQDEGLRIVKNTGEYVIFKYLKRWQRDGWARGVNANEKAYTYAMDAEGKVYGYCAAAPPAGSGLSEVLTYPEKRRERTTVSTRKPSSKKATTVQAAATKARKAKVEIEAVALPGAA